MRYLKQIVLFGALMAVLTSCSAYTPFYDIGLLEVERPAQAKERYGEQKITTTLEEGVTKYCFEDEMVKTVWLPTPNQVSFVLTNKTNHSIRIIWDEAAYVDEEGISHRVMHEGVKYIDREKPQPPTVVVRKATITDLVFPTDNIQYVSRGDKMWHKSPLFPTSAKTVDELKATTAGYVGKTIQVLLPLQIEDVVNEYIFVFEIKTVDVRKS